MNNTIIFLSIFVLLLNLTLMIKIRIAIDLELFCCVIKFKVFGVKVFSLSLDLTAFTYQTNYSKKKKSLSLLHLEEQGYLFKQIKKSVLDKLYYDYIGIEYQIYSDDKSLMANMSGLISLTLYYLRLCLRKKNEDTQIDICSKTNFLERKNYFKIDIKVLFTIFDMLFATILSFYKRGKYVREKKQKARG